MPSASTVAVPPAVVEKTTPGAIVAPVAEIVLTRLIRSPSGSLSFANRLLVKVAGAVGFDTASKLSFAAIGAVFSALIVGSITSIDRVWVTQLPPSSQTSIVIVSSPVNPVGGV